MPAPFVHLHVHSHYSLLQALPKVDELVKRAKELGQTALALTDYGAMYGAVEFYKECEKQGIKPIIGFEANVARHKHTDKRPRLDDRSSPLILLAETYEGYKNLMRLTTKAHLDGFYYKPRVDHDLLREYGKGIIALSAGLKGEIGNALAMSEEDKAKEIIALYQDIFGKDNFFLELQDHPELDEWQTRNQELIALSSATGAPLVGTKDVHYLTADDAEAQDLLTCIASGKTLGQDDRQSMQGVDYSLVDGDHMAKAFAYAPQAVENTVKIAERIDCKVPLGKWYFAKYPIPEGETYDTWLRKLAYDGVAAKVPEVTQEMRERLDYELDIIKNKGYSPYFLVVSDYIRWAKAQGIMTTTRGSAAGSFVSYGIDIVTADPLAYKLPFERFLNPFRPSPPDIDGDFADNRRDEVIQYAVRTYGRDKVAQIGTFGTLGAKAAVRDTGRALGYPYAFVDKVAKLIPLGSQGFAMSVERAVNETEELRKMIDDDPNVRRMIELAKKVEGCARHCSVHAAGVVISPEPLTEFMPLQREPGGDNIITQYDMHCVEDAGVLKMDFLGIRNLSILGEAVRIVKETTGVEIDLRVIPLDDKKTFELLAGGDTIGLFQLGGSGMTRYLKELKPTTIFDIMAMVALFRPGPMESIPEFIRRKHNPELVSYLDPRLETILNRSYGIMTYQDDVLLTSIHLAGYSWEEADKFRKAMGKKIPEEMMKQQEKFFSGILKNGGTKDLAEKLWELIKPFAAYGFNKAHAASYALVAYQTAYLKANYPAQFMTAVLTAESGDADTISEVVTECEKMGIKVLPPDVNSSGVNFTYIDDKAIRFGLLAIKNLGEAVAQAIIDERAARGPFRNVADLGGRVGAKDFNKKALESLIKSGAMDALGERNQLLASIDQILEHHRAAHRDRESGQFDLFSGLGGAGSDDLSAPPEVPMRQVPIASKREKLEWERELLGLYVSAHPFKDYADYFAGVLVPLRDLREYAASKDMLYFGAVVMDAKTITTKKGDEMCFAKLEDGSGSAELVVFPRTFAEYGDRIVKDAVLFVEGKYNEKDGEAKIICEAVKVLTPDNAEDIRRMVAGHKRVEPASGSVTLDGVRSDVYLAVRGTMTTTFAEELKRTLAKFAGSRRVFLAVRDGVGWKTVPTSFSIEMTSDAILAVEGILGKGAVLERMPG
jgi:DNA polymerase-3 subunit alpha